MKKRTKKEQDKINLCGEGKKFTKDNQPSPEAKSRGQIKKRAEENFIFNWRTFLESRYDKVAGIVDDEIAKGDISSYKEIMKICKPNEKQDIGLTGEVGIQKVFVTKKDIKDTDKHIDDIIEG